MDEDTDYLTIKQFTQFQRPLGEVTGAMQELVWQKIRGDQDFSLGIYNTHADTQAVADYYSGWAEPDRQENLLPDDESIQGWTYVADYTIHSKSPAAECFKYFIHARINYKNEIEFAAFDFVDENETTNEVFNLAEITGSEQDLVWQKKNKDLKPVLRIAGKEESEKMLLNGGKLKLSAMPQYAGYWVNKSNALYQQGSVVGGVRCYGHIWSYWYSIIDGVLYFVGLPLWTGETTGHVVHGSNSIKSVSIPPTEYDLSSNLIPNNPFREAMSLVTEVDLWGAGSYQFESPYQKTAGAARILEVYGDYTSETEITKRIIGKIDKQEVTQFHRGDIISDLGAFSNLGGVFNVNGSLKALSSGDYWSDRQSDSLTYNRGSSGYVAQKTKNTLEGTGMTCVYFITSYFIGNNLMIQCQGPRFVRSVEWNSLIDFTLPTGSNPVNPPVNPPIDPPDDPPIDPPIEPPNPNPPSPWPPTPNPPNPVPPTPIPPNPVITIQGGYIWRASNKGIKIVGKVKKNNSPFVNVEVEYTISVTATPKRKGTLNYPVTIDAVANGGGLYKLPESMREQHGDYATLSYGVAGDGDISLTNASTASGNSVSSSGSFTKNVIVPWHAEATFGSCKKTSKQNTINSNIVTATVTNKTETIRMWLQTTMTRKPFEADVEFQVIEVSLNENAVNEIIKNNTIQKIGSNLSGSLSPSNVNGSASNTKTRSPFISASMSGNPNRPVNFGQAQAVGEISMKVTNQRIEQGQAEFKVTNGTTGWNEENSRGSATISGSFKVTTPAKTL